MEERRAVVEVSPSDNIPKLVKAARPYTAFVFSSGTYDGLRIEVPQDYIYLVAGPDAEPLMRQTHIDFIGDNGVVSGMHFIGNSSVNASFESAANYDKICQGLIIENNTFRNFEGYAKRIRIASNMKHEGLAAYCTIRYNRFENIRGINNQGEPGGEIISVKAGNCVLFGNKFKDCEGLLSIRGGRNSTLSFNDFEGPYWCGVQIYNEGHMLLRNRFISKQSELRIGDGDAVANDVEVGRNHIAADWAQVTKNEGEGSIVIQRRYRRYRPQHLHFFKNGDLKIDNEWE